MQKILVSACLLGEPCRYDGESRDYPQIRTLFGKYEPVPFCPEQAGGLPTPRTPAEISGNGVFVRDGRDVTQQYLLGARRALALCEREGIRIAVLKARSPSCGKDEVYDGTFSHVLISGQGITASLLSGHGIAVYTEEEISEIPL